MTFSLNGLRIAILLTDGFEQVKMIKPSQALQTQGAQTFLISNKSTVPGWKHAEKADSFNTDILLENANPDEFDALLLPGGVMNPRLAKNNAHIVEKAQDIMERQVVQMARLIEDLLDLSLIAYNGYDVAKEIRKQPWGKILF
ncbi:DJ-1/PfpI family protein [Legionella sainthelensi]|uniref:DJ-1/PfpI family protein n=1 Tax=Legionella sainthelensi TaxID=28087 RepID=UPI000E20191D|nr:DJ-1/PfpI family protein [Legionella sainthelensi]